jgi:outer membrane protein OmpA-like peptidoglycan-associated protein
LLSRDVSFFLAQNSVTSSRVSTMGYGELQPVTDNSTPDGKQANRRVEVAIMANEKLKKAAQEKAN